MSAAYREAETDLGPLLQEFRARRVAPRVLFGSIFAGGAILDVVAGVSGVAAVGGPWPIVLLGVAFPALAAFGFLSTSGSTLRLHTRGFVIDGQEVAYEQVVELVTHRVNAQQNGQTTPWGDRHSIKVSDGRRVEVKWYGAEIDAILGELRVRTLPTLLSAAREGLEEGVRFGEITVDARGVRTEYTALAWSSITAASFDPLGPTVVVRGHGSGWLELKLEEVPNAHVLVALVNERVANREARQPE